MKSHDKRIKELNTSLLLFLEELKDYSDHTLNKKPDLNSWSVLQVMDHLIVAEKLSLDALKKSIAKNHNFASPGIGHFFRNRFLSFYLRSPIKFDAPTPVNTPALLETSTFWEVAKRWRRNREELYIFIRQLPPSVSGKMIYKHPRAGWLTGDAMLAFFQNHFDRHKKQVYRILDY